MKREKNTGGEGDNLVTVQTLVSWPDSSGPQISQLIYTPNKIFSRVSTSETTWSARFTIGSAPGANLSDMDAIKTLADVANKLQAGGLTNPTVINKLEAALNPDTENPLTI
jgi:hypothetical protein